MTEHAGSQLPLAMLLVFGTAKILGEISERLALPSIVGDILAGVLLGASVLNWVEPGQITQFSDLGVMFLLFRVGLEVKASDLFQVGRVASLVALLGVLLPFAMGYAIYIYTGSNQIEALFVGAAMVATSVGITAQVLAAKGLLNVRASRIILAAAVIDDILGLIVLAIVSSMARGTFDVLQLTTTAGLSIGFTLFVLSFGSRTMGRVLPGIDRRLRGGESQFSLAMILLFALAVFASYAGVALAESVSHRVQDLAQGVTELLVPFFLAGIGLALDVNVLRDPRTLTLAGVITVAAIVSKLLGCGLGALSLGWPDARRIGAGMVPRGEVGMVVAQLGAAMGIVSKATYGVVVVMAVLTTVVAPVLLALTFRSLAQMPEDPDESPIRIE